MTVKVDIRVPVGLPVQETADFIADCETAGFSGVGVHDHQHSGRDVFLTLALAAQRTSTLTVYPATTNPVTRHPGVLASLAHTLEEIAPGRVRSPWAPAIWQWAISACPGRHLTGCGKPSWPFETCSGERR